MSDPFRSELEAAHARIEKLEADHKSRVAELERENDRLRKRLVDAAPPSQSKTGKTFFAIAMMTLGVSLVGGMFFARVATPNPPIVEVPIQIPNMVDFSDDTPDPSNFDRDAVATALRGARVGTCVHRGGHVRVVIAPSGVITSAVVDRGSFTDSEKECIDTVFKLVRVSPFMGSPRTMGVSFMP